MSYPNVHICQLQTEKLSNDLFNIDRLETYVPQNPLVQKPHTHDFYHLTLLAKGKGKHIIDFQQFAATNQSIYFMKPHQVHSWDFQKGTTGFVLNFSATFLDSNFIHSSILHKFSFFQQSQNPIVYQLEQVAFVQIHNKLEQLYTEQQAHQELKNEKIAQLLLGLLIDLSRLVTKPNPITTNKTQQDAYQTFLELLEQNYTQWKHTKEYAQAMHISPQHLLQIVKQNSQQSPGELIRERIVLEAKRMLVNEDKTVSQIAFSLNFTDDSYFVKFFKKYTALTPEQFRQQL